MSLCVKMPPTPIARIALVVAVGSLVATGSTVCVNASPAPADTCVVLQLHPGLGARMPLRIAVLPAVSFDGNVPAALVLEEQWEEVFRLTGHRWSTAAATRQLMAGASGRPDSLYDSMASSIRAGGAVDEAMAGRIARLCASDALLCLRIDRWDYSKLEILATLQDSTGVVLWQVSGRSVNRLGGRGPGRHLAGQVAVPSETKVSGTNSRDWTVTTTYAVEPKPGGWIADPPTVSGLYRDFGGQVTVILTRIRSELPPPAPR